VDTSPFSLAQKIPESVLETFPIEGYLRLELACTTAKAVADAFEAAFTFFHSPLEEKLLNVLPADGGYRPFGIEYSRSPDVRDQIESFTTSYWTHSFVEHLPTVSARQLHAKMAIVSDSLESIAEALTVRLEEGIRGYSSPTLRGGFQRWSRLQLNYSRPESIKTPFINELHEDGVLMTVTAVTGPGLEVQLPNGSVKPVVTRPNEVLAMTGEIAYLLSGGVIPAVYHQVRPIPECSERLALVFLGDVDPYRCVPWIETSINKGVDIGERVRTSAKRYGLQGFTPDMMEDS
jgi:isopenicillin N synthase-like dioxygenase